MILPVGAASELRVTLLGPRAVKLALLALLLAAFAVRLFRLDAQSIWWDEARNIEVAQLPLSSISNHPGLDIHPPLFFYLFHFWIAATGTTELATRFFSVAFSLLWMAALYQLGRALAGERLGLLAALLAALSPLSIHEAQEARMYTLALALVTLSTYSLWVAWRTRRWQPGLGYVLTAAAALGVHYSAGLVIAAQNAWVLVALIRMPPSQRGSSLRAWLLAQAGIGVFFLPQAGRALEQLAAYRNPNLSPPSHAEFLRQIWQFYNTELTIDPGRAALALIWMGLLLGLGSVVLLQRAHRDVNFRAPLSLIALWIGLPLFLYWLAVQERSYFHPRYTTLIVPAYFLLLAICLGELIRRWQRGGVLAAFGLLAVFGVADYSYYFDARYFRDDVRGAVGYVNQVVTARDVIVLDFPFGFGLYYQGPAPFYFLPGDLEEAPTALARLAQGRDRLYLVRSFRSDLDLGQVVPFLLGKSAQLLGEIRYPGYAVTAYDLPAAPNFVIAGRWTPAAAQFGEELTLLEYSGAEGEEVPSGGTAWAALRWRSRSPLSADYKASTLLYDGGMHMVGQADRPLVNQARIYTSDWALGEDGYSLHLIPVEPATPPGEYRLALAVYDPQTLGRLGVHDAQGKFLGATLTLGTVRVSRPARAPEPSSLSIQYRLQERFEAIELLGYDLSVPSLHPGDRFSLALYWRALARPTHDYVIQFSAPDGEGLWQGPLLESFPPSQWLAGDIWRVWYDLRLDPATAIGPLDLSTRLLNADDGRSLGELGIAGLSVEPGRAHSFELPFPQIPLDLALGPSLKLLGYDLPSSTLRPGESLLVTLYWQSRAPSDVDYTVFTHLLAEDNQIWGQVDSPPLGGAAPTSSWLPGEVIADPYTIPLDPQAPAGSYWLEFGLYDPRTGQRLLFQDAAGNILSDRFLVGPISVLPR